MKDRRVKFPVRLCIFALSLFVLSFSVSYSFFTTVPQINNPENATTLVTTDYLDFDFGTTEYINNENLVLLKRENVATDADKTVFNVARKAGSNYDIKYNIYLTELNISDNLKSEDFKWDLLQNGVSIYSGSFLAAESNEMFTLTADPLVINNDASKSYELRVWLEESEFDQASLLNGSFSAKVAIDVFTVSKNK